MSFTRSSMPRLPSHAGPCPALPAEPRRTMPCRATPHHTSPCLPHLARPDLATPSHAGPNLAQPCLPRLATPGLASPRRTPPRLPGQAQPYPAWPCHTAPSLPRSIDVAKDDCPEFGEVAVTCPQRAPRPFRFLHERIGHLRVAHDLAGRKICASADLDGDVPERAHPS
jgi:hypothetical protein